MATVGGDETARIWNASTGQQVITVGGIGRVRECGFTRNDEWLVTQKEHTTRFWNCRDGIEGNGIGLAYVGRDTSPDGLRKVNIHFLSDTATIERMDSGRSFSERELVGHTSYINAAVFSADGRQVITASSDGTAKTWDVATGQELGTLNGHGGAVTAASFSPDHRRIATGGDDQTVYIWDTSTFALLDTLKVHADKVSALAFSPTGERLATAGWDGVALVWERKRPEGILGLVLLPEAWLCFVVSVLLVASLVRDFKSTKLNRCST